MANIQVEVGGRRYAIACRDGEEAHLRELASLVDVRARDAAVAVGAQTENRQLLLAALLVADDLNEARKNSQRAEAPPPPPSAVDDPALVDALEALASRIEKIAERLEEDALHP